MPNVNEDSYDITHIEEEQPKMQLKREPSSVSSLEDAVTIILKLRSELEAEKLNSSLVSKENEELKQQNAQMQQDVISLRQRYFFSIAMAMKLERSISQPSLKSYNVQMLWNQIEEQEIPFREWPEWLSNKFFAG